MRCGVKGLEKPLDSRAPAGLRGRGVKGKWGRTENGGQTLPFAQK